MSQLNRQARSKKTGKFLPPLPFCPLQALKGLDNAHSHLGGQAALLSQQIQKLISPGNSLTDTHV